MIRFGYYIYEVYCWIVQNLNQIFIRYKYVSYHSPNIHIEVTMGQETIVDILKQ